jgi:hypothetical protein
MLDILAAAFLPSNLIHAGYTRLKIDRRSGKVGIAINE